MRLGFFSFLFLLIAIANATSYNQRLKLKRRKYQHLPVEEYAIEFEALEKAIKKHLGKSSYPIPYPLRTNDLAGAGTAFYFCKQFYSLFPEMLLSMIRPVPQAKEIANHVEAPLIICFYQRVLELSVSFKMKRRVAHSLCFYKGTSREEEQAKCLWYVSALMGPTDLNISNDSKNERCFPWLLLRALLIKVDLLPMDELIDFASVSRMIMTALQRVSLMERQATTPEGLSYDTAAEFLLILQETLMFFFQASMKQQRFKEAIVYLLYFKKLEDTELFRKVSRGDDKLRWEVCFDTFKDAFKTSLTVNDEIYSVKRLNVEFISILAIFYSIFLKFYIF